MNASPLGSSSSSFDRLSSSSDDLRTSTASVSSASKASAKETGRAAETPLANPRASAKDVSSANKFGVLTHLLAFVQRADAWPYETGKIGTRTEFNQAKNETVTKSGLGLNIYQPGHHALEQRKEAGVKSGIEDPTIKNINPNRPTSKLGCFGFDLLKLAKDMVLLGPRLAAGALGTAVGLTMLGGALLAAPFSNQLKGQLLYAGLGLSSVSLLTGLSAIGRISFSIADLAKPLTEVDTTTYTLGKITKYAIIPANEMAKTVAMKFTATSFNPSSSVLDEDDDLGLDADDLAAEQKQAQQQAQRDKLELGESAKKIMGLLPAIAGSFTVASSADTSTVWDLSEPKKRSVTNPPPPQ